MTVSNEYIDRMAANDARLALRAIAKHIDDYGTLLLKAERVCAHPDYANQDARWMAKQLFNAWTKERQVASCNSGDMLFG